MSKNEILMPLFVDKYIDNDKRFVEVRSQEPLRVEAIFVDGKDYDLPVPAVLQPGQIGRFAAPAGTALSARAGVYASVLGQSGTHACAGEIIGETSADCCDFAIAPNAAIIARYDPAADPTVGAVRFKGLQLDMSAEEARDLLVSDVRIGKESMLRTPNAVPIAMFCSGRVNIPTTISPGVLLTISFSNAAATEVKLRGYIVFERVPSETKHQAIGVA